MYRNKKSRIAFSLLSVLLLAMLLTALPISAAEAEETDYDAYYVEGAKIAWDAFDRHTGDTHTEEEKVLFKKYNSNTVVGTFGEGYLSVKDAALDFSALFGNDGKTDYTLDLTVAMQNSSSGTLQLGALRSFQIGVNNGISATDKHPVDASFGIVSNTYSGLTNPAGGRVQFATDVGWKKTHFIGKPLGEVYSFGVSGDYTVDETNAGSAVITLWRDSASVQSSAVRVPVMTHNGTVPSDTALDTSIFRTASSLNFDYYAIRYYERVLKTEEMAQNHFVDLAKWFSVSLDVYDTYDQATRNALHLALREETFDTLTKSVLQSTVDSFGSYKKALNADDYIFFEGFSAALYGAPGLRSVYEVDLSAIKALEKEGYQVTVGALVAIENGRNIADITLENKGQVIAREVYQNGEFTDSIISSDEDSFRFALTTRFDSTTSSQFYEENLLYRAFITFEKDGKSETLYLDAEGDTFGNSLSVKDVSLLLAFLGNTHSTPIGKVLGDTLTSLASDSYESFAPIFKSRENALSLAYGISDYLFTSYALRASVMTTTGVSSGVYSYEKASPYYKLFDTSHVARNVAGHETVTLLLQCENAASTASFAYNMTNKLQTEVLAQQALYGTASSFMATLKEAANAKGLTAEEADALTAFLASCIKAHEKAIADIVRDVKLVNSNMQAVKETLDAPAQALGALRQAEFKQNDLPAFGTEDKLSAFAIVTDKQNESAALMLSSILSDKYGVFVPYYSSFPATAEYARKISLFDASASEFAALLGDNDYALTMQDGNAVLLGQTPSDAQLAAVVLTRSLTKDSLILQESFGRDVADLFSTDLPTYLPTLNVKAVEDGGVMDRFNQVLLEMPDEYAVVNPLSSADYPMSTVNTVYVSPNGNDLASGTYFEPFKTLERAFEYALGKGGAQILLFGGTYRIDSALTLSAIHSGSKQSPLYVSAMPGEEVLFTTADTVMGKDFVPVTDESAIARLNTFTANNHKNVYVADLAALGITSYGKTTTSGEPLFLLDGEQYNLARFPNKGETLTPLLTAGCIIKQSQVTTGSSYLYPNHNTSLETAAGWKLRIDTNSAYRERLEKWTWTDGTNTAESIWMHGALYEEWHRAHYPLVIKNEVVDTTTGEQDITMSSTSNCGWGVYDKLTDNAASARTSRNGYFYNIMEELDADGEWYLDHKTGKLYVYSSVGIASDARATIISDTHTILTVSNASNIVLNGITFAETLGNALRVTSCENVLVQNCTFRDTRANACVLEKSYNSGIIFSDFSRTSTTMLSVSGTGDRKTMTPDRLFVQNCYFHDPIVQSAIGFSGISSLVSHNHFEDTTITFSGAECILEYNEFHRGSQITYDSGPIYCSGPSGPKGNHIRYNYLYELNFSLYGIYIDDLSSDNYVYSNIVTYDESVTKSSKGVNLHNGHQNVVMNNILVNAKDSGVRDNANYYVKNVKYTRKYIEQVKEWSWSDLKYIYKDVEKTEENAVLKLQARAYRTSADGTQTVTDSNEGSGGLGYRWPSLMGDALSSYQKNSGADSRYAERFPNLDIYMELVAKQIENSKANASYSHDNAYIEWAFEVKNGTKYPWGDASLRDFLMASAKQDIDTYVRAAAYNEYRNNIFLGCSTDIYVYSQWGLLTTTVKDNYGYPATSEYFTQAMQGDLSKITQASTWASTVPGFESIPYEKFGRTEETVIDIYCPRPPVEEDSDFNLPFDQLLGNN